MPREEDITTELPAVHLTEDGPFVLALRHAVRTDTGLVRSHNEDDFLVIKDEKVYMVADGMGGHKAGAVASQICVDTVDAYYKEHRSSTTESSQVDADLEHVVTRADTQLADALIDANRAIFQASSGNSALQGMGTTVVAVRFVDNALTVCHAGDSRVYMFRNGDLRRLTNDHSLSNFLRSIGREAEGRLAEATMSNVIMRALGLEPEVEIETSLVTVEPGDRILLCSDGLSDLVSDDRISSTLLEAHQSREQTVEALVELALDAGGRDNITAMLVDVYEQSLAPQDPDAFAGRSA